MKITIQRINNLTEGELFIDGKYFCDTLEPPTTRAKGRIRAGEYDAEKTWSPKFRSEKYRLQNVPGFTGILIHEGNSTADTRGCILLGQRRGEGRLFNSKATLAAFEALTGGIKITVEIKNP